jgi:hypothetical protein
VFDCVANREGFTSLNFYLIVPSFKFLAKPVPPLQLPTSEDQEACLDFLWLWISQSFVIYLSLSRNQRLVLGHVGNLQLRSERTRPAHNGKYYPHDGPGLASRSRRVRK